MTMNKEDLMVPEAIKSMIKEVTNNNLSYWQRDTYAIRLEAIKNEIEKALNRHNRMK